MRNHGWRFAGLFALMFALLAGGADDKRRNPFDVDDIADPDDQTVKDFAGSVTLAGDKDDKNAEQWVEKETEGKAGSLDGEWSSRYESVSGRAKVKAIKDKVYILYTDVVDGVDGTTWMLELTKFDKNKLRGKWVNVANKDEAGVFYGVIVDDERIDGLWTESNRWDFRRKLKK